MRGRKLTEEEKLTRAAAKPAGLAPDTYALAGRPESEALPHGTSKYSNEGCKCTVCRAAWSEYQKQLRLVRAERIKQDPSLAVHGKPTTYRNWLCKCDLCKAAWAAQARKLHGEKRQGGAGDDGREGGAGDDG